MLTLMLALIVANPVEHNQAKTAADEAERAAGQRDKVVCKRFVETGSLVRGYKQCKTKWEWERERENVRQLNVPNSESTNN